MQNRFSHDLGPFDFWLFSSNWDFHYKSRVVRETNVLHMRKQRCRSASQVTAKLISAFVFATWIIQNLYFLNTKFQASSHLQWLIQPGLCQTWSESTLFSHVAAHNVQTVFDVIFMQSLTVHLNCKLMKLIQIHVKANMTLFMIS